MALSILFPLSVWPTSLPLHLSLAIIFLLSLLLLLLLLTLYRLFLHPLAHIPGPPLYALSSLPILHHYTVSSTPLLHALPPLHAKYGPVIRIAPNEVHLSDPAHYDTIYSMGTKYQKDAGFYKPMEGPVATPILLTILSGEEHRVRRKMLTPFFSRGAVLKVEGMVWEKAGRLCDVMEGGMGGAAGGSGMELWDAYKAFRAVAIDVITEYAYARCWGMLDQAPDYGNWYPEAIRSVQTMFPWLQAVPGLAAVFGAIPEWLKVLVFPPYRRWKASLDAVAIAVGEVRKEIAEGTQRTERRTIMHELIDPLPGLGGERVQPLGDAAVFADAVNVTGAGTETTGATKERAVYEVLSHREVYAALADELRGAFPDPREMRLTALERLPILTGVIKEALRLNPGVPGRLPRVVPAGGATFNGLYLPPGAVVSMSAWDMHNNTRVFPSPQAFDPWRWIASDSGSKGSTVDQVRERERHLVAFSKGSRGCVGQNLAMCELYCTIAAIFRRFGDMSLRVAPDFRPEDMAMTELVLGYHPRKRRFRIYRAKDVEGVEQL